MELRDALAELPDVLVLYVVAANQMNGKSRRFITANGLGDRVRFLVDAESRTIDGLRLRNPDAKPIEEGVPHPATYVLDRQGVVRFVDVRTDFHFWLDPGLAVDALRAIP